MKAFPTADFIIQEDKQGMDLRDYFAAKSISFWCKEAMSTTEGAIDKEDVEWIAYRAYFVADAMMREREKSNG